MDEPLSIDEMSRYLWDCVHTARRDVARDWLIYHRSLEDAERRWDDWNARAVLPSDLLDHDSIRITVFLGRHCHAATWRRVRATHAATLMQAQLTRIRTRGDYQI